MALRGRGWFGVEERLLSPSRMCTPGGPPLWVTLAIDAADEAVDLATVDPRRAAEADRVQLAVSDQLIRLGPADREQLGRLLDVQEPRTGPFGVVVVHGDLLMFAALVPGEGRFSGRLVTPAAKYSREARGRAFERISRCASRGLSR